MHRSTHKMLTVVIALLIALVASEALADGSRGHGRGYGYGSGNHGSRYHGRRTTRLRTTARTLTTATTTRCADTRHLRAAARLLHLATIAARLTTTTAARGIARMAHATWSSRRRLESASACCRRSTPRSWYGGSPYYYADSTYYSYRPERREYVVTEPPRGEAEERYPSRRQRRSLRLPAKNGQSEEQQATDRYDVPSLGGRQDRLRSHAARGQRGRNRHDLEARRLSARGRRLSRRPRVQRQIVSGRNRYTPL